MACMDPSGTVGSIYKGEYYTFIQTKYESSGPYGFGEDFFYVFPIVSLRELLTPIPTRGAAISDPKGMLGRIYVKLHITMLYTKYRSFGCCGFTEDFVMFFFSIVSIWQIFSCFFPIVSIWQIMTPKGRGLYGPQGHS